MDKLTLVLLTSVMSAASAAITFFCGYLIGYFGVLLIHQVLIGG